MEIFITKLMERFNSLCEFLRKKNKFKIQRSAMIIYISFTIISVIVYFANNKTVTKISGSSFVLILFSLILLFNFDTEDKVINKITKGKYLTPRALVKEYSHISYFYGLLFFTLETSFLVGIIIYSVEAIIFGKIEWMDYNIIWITMMFIYTFLYFSYHLYLGMSKDRINIVEQRIKLYTAMGSTISFIMFLWGENHIFKVFIVGTLLEFTWFQYLIIKKKNEVEDLKNCSCSIPENQAH